MRLQSKMAAVLAGSAILCLSGLANAQPAAGSKDSGAAGQAIHACSLLTADEISAAIGTPVAAGAPTETGSVDDGAYSSTCFWKIPVNAGSPNVALPPDGMSYAILNVIAWPAGSGRAKKYLEDFRSPETIKLIGTTPEPVKAGDDALWWGDGVAVRKGDISFGVSAHVINKKMTQRAMEEALAKKVAGKL